MNIVKETCKELGISQKELASIMGIAENTLSQWARGVVNTPIWALKMFELLRIERKFNIIKSFFDEQIRD